MAGVGTFTALSAAGALALSSPRFLVGQQMPAKQRVIDKGLKTACNLIIKFYNDNEIPVKVVKASRGYQVINIECRIPALINTKKIVATRQDLEHFLLAKGTKMIQNSLKLQVAGTLTISWSTKATQMVYLSKVYRMYYNGCRKAKISGVFPIGLTMNGEPYCIRLNKEESPHAMLVGATGSGKSVASMSIVVGALSAGWDVYIWNPKIQPAERSLGLWDFKDFKGVTYINNYDDMVTAMKRLATTMELTTNPTLVVADELADTIERLRAEIATPLGAISQKGREYDIHLVGIAPKLTKAVLFSDMLHANAGTTLLGFRMNNKYLSQYGTGMGGMDLEKLAGNGHCMARTGSTVTEVQIALPDNINSVRTAGGEVHEHQKAIMPITEKWLNNIPSGGEVSKDSLRRFASSQGSGIGYPVVQQQYDTLAELGRITLTSQYKPGVKA